MEWTVQIGSKSHRVKLPDTLPDNTAFLIELNGRTTTAKWQRTTKTLFLQSGAGSEKCAGETPVWVPIFCRNRLISRFAGESETNISLEFTPAGSSHTLCVESAVSLYIPGQETRENGVSKKPKIIRSQITGKVLKVLIKPDDVVATGDTMMIVEAMKMENRVVAAFAGTVDSIKVSEGDTISSGKELMRFK